MSENNQKTYLSNSFKKPLSSSEILGHIKEQYETLPYPLRRPEDDTEETIKKAYSPSSIFEIANFIFKGQRDFSKPFRVLVAGGGTGDASTYLGYVLKKMGVESEIIHLDLSEPSQKIAAGRAKKFNLDNVKFVNGSILDCDKMDLGEFDYIDSCGVLHHLPQTEDGFKVLSKVLKPDGGMGIMMYGTIGRMGIYEIQRALKMILKDSEKPMEKTVVAQKVLKQLPENNILQGNKNIGWRNRDDNEIYDMFCHVKDRSFTVPEILKLADEVEMKVETFIYPALYNPEFYFSDEEVLSRMDKLSKEDKWIIAELLAGNMNKHIFYLTKKGNKIEKLSFDDENNVVIADQFLKNIFKDVRPGKIIGSMNLWFGNVRNITVKIPDLSSYIVDAIDNKRTVKEVFEYIKRNTGHDVDEKELRAEFKELCDVCENFGYIFPSKYPFPI